MENLLKINDSFIMYDEDSRKIIDGKITKIEQDQTKEFRYYWINTKTLTGKYELEKELIRKMKQYDPQFIMGQFGIIAENTKIRFADTLPKELEEIKNIIHSSDDVVNIVNAIENYIETYIN